MVLFFSWESLLKLPASIFIVVTDISQSESGILQSKEEDRIEDLR
jgi:hypothetical protein